MTDDSLADSEPPIEAVVVDDHPVVRQGMRAMHEVARISVTGESADRAEALRVVAEVQPDVVIMDLAMPGMSGIDATRRPIASTPHLAVLVVSMSDDDDTVFAAVRAGARGYVLKGSDPSDVVRAVRSVARGDAVFGPGLAERVLGYFSNAHQSNPPLFPELTAREREVLVLLGRGVHNPEISRRLGIRPKTVRNLASNVLTRLAVADRTEAVLKAREAGLT